MQRAPLGSAAIWVLRVEELGVVRPQKLERTGRGTLDLDCYTPLLFALRAQHTGSQIELPLVFAPEQ